jgi:hypothetical protein
VNSTISYSCEAIRWIPMGVSCYLYHTDVFYAMKDGMKKYERYLGRLIFNQFSISVFSTPIFSDLVSHFVMSGQVYVISRGISLHDIQR